MKNRGVEVYAGHSLRALVPAGEKEVGLVFDGGAFAAKHVMLALPSLAIGALRGIPPDILELVDSVIRYPLLKCFFVVQDPWWEEDTPNMGVRSFPARELHYFTQGDRGNVMVYADRPSISFWGGYVGPGRHDRAEVGGNPDLASAFAGRMSRGDRPVPIPIESVGDPGLVGRGSPIAPTRVLAFGVRDWRRPPYGAGVHLWRAGVKPWQVAERLEAFSLGGGPPCNVHICGEAFSDYQGFMEGAVRSAHRALTKAVDW
ncbi:MAG: FAD-dependent oxidoreductase [Chloroflexi bacterium]|nr:FAD-dependent oxidoreductase [Chloroflexota bacterium]